MRIDGMQGYTGPIEGSNPLQWSAQTFSSNLREYQQVLSQYKAGDPPVAIQSMGVLLIFESMQLILGPKFFSEKFTPFMQGYEHYESEINPTTPYGHGSIAAPTSLLNLLQSFLSPSSGMNSEASSLISSMINNVRSGIQNGHIETAPLLTLCDSCTQLQHYFGS